MDWSSEGLAPPWPADAAQLEWAGVDVLTGDAWGVGWVPITWCTDDVRAEARRLEGATYPAKRVAPAPVGSRRSPRLAESADVGEARRSVLDGAMQAAAAAVRAAVAAVAAARASIGL